MNISITDICENTKMGREFALLGNYETALVYYQGVVQQVSIINQCIYSSTSRHHVVMLNFIHRSIDYCKQ